MSNHYLLIFSISLLFQSCSESENSASNTAESANTDSIHYSNQNRVPDASLEVSDTLQIHVFKKGDTLWDLCKKYYGNRHYSSILSIYNGIKNVNQIDPGTEIKIPPLSRILTDSDFGLVPPFEKEVYKILAARQLYLTVEPEIWELRRALNWKGNQALPKNIVSSLDKAADLIDLTILQLNQPKKGFNKRPKQMSDNLKSVSRNLKHLASGANDSYGYDLDMVHQDLIRAIHSGRAWVKKNYNPD